jgi:hypothetical protein
MMFKSEIQRNKIAGVVLPVIFLCMHSLFGCGGNGASAVSGEGSPESDPRGGSSSSDWEQVSIAQLQAGGMLSPHVKAMAGGNDKVHIVYFHDSEENDSAYTINHIVWDCVTQAQSDQDAVIEVDNCRTLGLCLSDGGDPVVAYQGGTVRECGSEQQSDVMISVEKGDEWSEYTGGIGFVERNPVFEDGLAGKTISVAVDSSGDIHLCYQFFYEGCDAMNFNFPDLLYVKKDGAALNEDGGEETVAGNVYNPNGTASEQNDVGDHAVIILDQDEDPVIFYYADLSPTMPDPDMQGLRVSRRQDGEWRHAWIETGIEVGDISCVLKADGSLAVAYYVEGEYTDSLGSHSQCLKYAVEQSSSWTAMMVDESVLCGAHCSLAFDASGNPAIAYYALENHSGSISLKDLKFAAFNGASWDTETVASTGDIGIYNTLWFDDSGTAYICTYSNSQKEIYVFYR